MVPVCPPLPGKKRCYDYEANYERFPRQVIKPPPPESPADDCFALRFSLMSESAAHAIERPLVEAGAGK